MPSPISIGTRDVPLKLAEKLTNKVNEFWGTGEFLQKTTPLTQDLLKFWFCEPHTQSRPFNFHEGQKQAILNTIYLQEIAGVRSVKEIYENVDD